MSNVPSPSEPWSLKGKTAVITGGSRGIGSGIAVHFARKGLSNLAITYVANEAAANKTLEKCRKLGVKNAITIQADVTDTAVGPKIIKEAVSRLSVTTIDILVNNAILGDVSRTVDLKTLEAKNFNEIMVGNVYSPVSLTVAFMEFAPKYGGRVINISSTASKTGNPEFIMTYGATKAALDSYTRSFADTFASSTGITFNSVSVGPTETDALAAAKDMLPGFVEEQIKSISAAPRFGTTDDVAYIVGFLASEEGRWVNGAAVSANGGHRLTLALFG
ncbi:Putative short-chain dehydrogenase/reductase SDR, NAD(P)-binding domain superfamily [Colletotrichum destructivum]|uniref:Short-chain dehydrogenase/reductase SDR, NAD(P)-binding domain superfamily n=1 Tax=Colletotrichum destructivum TaxID=34406 RepID=A0AAX4J413_9PEZI|nr:Putative short-chain dehydrogenase/reductase SDR, NAD(P)-binding domain superfamily [Colletotrichum destructivum]